jgi:RNA polymerase sigma factor (sigma-70 family)
MARNVHQLYPGRTSEADDRGDERWRRMWSHREQLLKVARRRSMSVEDAEDAVHEAMLRAGENPNIDDERLAAWLTTVTVRLCVDRYRQLNREAEVGSRSALAAPAPVPVEEAVCDQAEAKWLERRSKSLPARQAEALRLKSEELDVGQVATQMGLSYEATESLLSRARRAMRGALAGTLALIVWLVRGRPENGVAQAAALTSTAVTLAVLGIALPYSDEGEKPRAPRVSRAEGSEKSNWERDRKEPAPPPRSAAREEPGPTRIPGTRTPLDAATSLVPRLSAPTTPEVPEVPEAPRVPDVPALPTVPSPPDDVKLPTDKPTPAGPGAPTDASEPPVDLPDSSATPTDVRKPLG